MASGYEKLSGYMRNLFGVDFSGSNVTPKHVREVIVGNGLNLSVNESTKKATLSAGSARASSVRTAVPGDNFLSPSGPTDYVVTNNVSGPIVDLNIQTTSLVSGDTVSIRLLAAQGSTTYISQAGKTEDLYEVTGLAVAADMTFFVRFDGTDLQRLTSVSDIIVDGRPVQRIATDSTITVTHSGTGLDRVATLSSSLSLNSTPITVAVAKPAAGTVLTTFQSGHGWISAYAGYAAIDLNSTVDPFVGPQCANVTSAGTGAVTGLKKWAMTAMDFTGKCLRVAIKVTNLAHLDATDGIWVYIGSSSLANYRVFVIKPQTQHWLVEGEWCELTIPWNQSASRSSTGGTLSRSSVTDLTVRFKDDNTGNQVTVALGRVSIVAETTPSISFTFDDGYDTVYTTAFPILFAKGWAATHYTICGLIDQAGRMTTAQLKALQRSGWDIALHSFSAAVHTATYPGTTASALEYDIEKGKEWLKSRGFKGYTHGSFPLGLFVGATDALSIVRQRFAAFRSIYSLVGESYPPDDPHKLRITVNLSYPLSLASAQALIDTAIAAKEHVTILCHNLVTTPTVEGQWATADFQSLCDYISTTYPSVAVSPIGNALSIV